MLTVKKLNEIKTQQLKVKWHAAVNNILMGSFKTVFISSMPELYKFVNYIF